jgi:hypothetical protein
MGLLGRIIFGSEEKREAAAADFDTAARTAVAMSWEAAQEGDSAAAGRHARAAAENAAAASSTRATGRPGSGLWAW